jgi:hypothetical protein
MKNKCTTKNPKTKSWSLEKNNKIDKSSSNTDQGRRQKSIMVHMHPCNMCRYVHTLIVFMGWKTQYCKDTNSPMVYIFNVNPFNSFFGGKWQVKKTEALLKNNNNKKNKMKTCTQISKLVIKVGTIRARELDQQGLKTEPQTKPSINTQCSAEKKDFQ